jgi:hypothetical protein
MENETEVIDRPVDNDDVIELDPSDFFDESSTVEDTTEPETEEVSTPAETEEKEVDFKPLFEELKERLYLKLIKTNVFRSGVVQLIYEPSYQNDGK